MRNSTSKLSLSLAFCGSLMLITSAHASVSKEESSSNSTSITSTQQDSEKKEAQTKSPAAGQTSSKSKPETKSTAHMFITTLVNAVHQTSPLTTNTQTKPAPKTSQSTHPFVATTPATSPTPAAPTPDKPEARVESYTIQGTLMELQNGQMVVRVQSTPKNKVSAPASPLVSAVYGYRLVRIETISTQKLSAETMVSLAERVFETVRVTYQVQGDSPKFAIDVR